jgi:DNA-binding transcriptional regulator YhcF (GntR family)
MDLVINTTAPEPIYEQIVRQIHDGVRTGRLKPGTPLPPVRQLAADLRLNRNTVARAYKTLDEQGVIVTAGRKGTFVRHDAAQEVARAKSGHAERTLRHTIDVLRNDGLSRKEISTLFNSVITVENRKADS